MKGQARKRSLEAKKTRKKHRMENPGSKSNYAKKEAYLHNHGGWGFEYFEPKPWK